MDQPRQPDAVEGPTAPWLRLTPGALFALLRQHPDGGLAKSEVAALTGVSRTAVSQRVDALVAAGLLTPAAPATAARGRPAERFTVNADHGIFLVADTGVTGMRSAVCGPTGSVLVERHDRIDITSGPDVVLGAVGEAFRSLLERVPARPSTVLGVGLSVPGPVDHESGRVVSPPVMTGWHEFDIRDHFTREFGCPVVVENDVNAMVLGEHRTLHQDIDDMVMVKWGTGVGAGLFLGGRLFRGADGAAGDIGHVPVDARGTAAPVCRCGNHGCVEAHAGGWAILRDLRHAGLELQTIDDLVHVVRGGSVAALRCVREAAEVVGAAVADLVNTVNPRLVVLGGQLAELDDIILAIIREVIYRRSPRLATRKLAIVASETRRPGVLGLAAMVTDHVYSVGRVDGLVAGES